MIEERLPANLEQVEQELRPLLQFPPPTEFSQRLLHAMRGEMRRQRTVANWRFAIAIAAAAFVWLHLSFFLAPATDFHFRGSCPAMLTDRRLPQTLFARPVPTRLQSN
jgi:hypothetical protein